MSDIQNSSSASQVVQTKVFLRLLELHLVKFVSVYDGVFTSANAVQLFTNDKKNLALPICSLMY